MFNSLTKLLGLPIVLTNVSVAGSNKLNFGRLSAPNFILGSAQA